MKKIIVTLLILIGILILWPPVLLIYLLIIGVAIGGVIEENINGNVDKYYNSDTDD